MDDDPTMKPGIGIADFERAVELMLGVYDECTTVPGKGMRAALEVGRTLLNTGHAKAALHIFQLLERKFGPLGNPKRYIILGNIGYAYTDLGARDSSNYDKAIAKFCEIQRDYPLNFKAWHAIGLACALYRRGKDDDEREIRRLLHIASDRLEFRGSEVDRDLWQRLYPEFSVWIQSGKVEDIPRSRPSA